MGASSSTPPRLDVAQLSTWTTTEVQQLREFYVRERWPFAMGRESFVSLISDAPLQSINIFGRPSGVGTLGTDLWHVLGLMDVDGEDDAGGSGSEGSPTRAFAPEPCAVSALELFAGLCVYVHGDTTTKIGLLFDIFDVTHAASGGRGDVNSDEGVVEAGMENDSSARGQLTHDELVLLFRAAHSGCCKLLQRYDLLVADDFGADALSRACFAAVRVPIVGAVRKNQLVAWGSRQLGTLGPLRTLEATLQVLASGPPSSATSGVRARLKAPADQREVKEIEDDDS